MFAISLSRRALPLVSISARCVTSNCIISYYYSNYLVMKSSLTRSFSEEPDDLVIDVSSMDNYSKYKKEEKPSVVCFSSKKSDDCRRIAPLFSFFSTKVQEANFLKVDVLDSPDIAEAEGVTTVPAYKLFQNNQLLLDFVGANGVQLMEMIEMAQARKVCIVC